MDVLAGDPELETIWSLQSRPRGVCDLCTAAFASGVAAVSSSGVRHRHSLRIGLPRKPWRSALRVSAGAMLDVLGGDPELERDVPELQSPTQ
eukprot:8353817-Alexandrium_andersonii.AAC.1